MCRIELSFNQLFEMKYLLVLLSLLFQGGSNFFECNTHAEFAYKLPDGFETLNTFEENGLLTVLDGFGNSANIYLEERKSSSEENPFDDLNIATYGEVRFEDGGYLARFRDNGPIDPFDTAFYFHRGNRAVYAFLYRDGDPKTHGVFEEKTMQIAREIAQGGKNEKAWSDCFRVLFHFDDWRSGCGS